jgi:cytochrome P450
MELRMAYPALVRRFPNLALAVAAETLTYRKLSFVYGVESVPVHLNPTASR